MGYRSEVVFKVGPEALEELEELSNTDPELEELLRDMKADALEKSDAYNVFYYSWVKWYREDPQIQMLMDFFKKLDAEGRDDEYGFIRLGEDDSDIEVLGSPYDIGLGYSRHVTF